MARLSAWRIALSCGVRVLDPYYKFIRVRHPESAFDENGPIHQRGISVPGLFFVGLKFQHTVGSHLLRGVGRDAEYIARKIAERKTVCLHP